MDIEGGEYELLPAMRPLLERPDCRVLLSLHPGILATVLPDAASAAATAATLEVFGLVRSAGSQRACRASRRHAIWARADQWLFVKARATALVDRLARDVVQLGAQLGELHAAARALAVGEEQRRRAA